MQSRLYTNAVTAINTKRTAAQAKHRRRPACPPEHAQTYIHAQEEQEAAGAAQYAVSGPDRAYAAGLAMGYDLARNALRKSANVPAALRRNADQRRRLDEERARLGLRVDYDYSAGFYAALADVLARVAPVENWIEQGYNARLMDLDRPTQMTPEADAWRAGWDLADSLIQANADEAEAKPGLDPLPLPAWSELVGMMEVAA